MKTNQISYQAIITNEDNYWFAEFPDCPGCQTFADTRGEVLEAAKEALEGWVETQIQENRIVPEPLFNGGTPIYLDEKLIKEIIDYNKCQLHIK